MGGGRQYHGGNYRLNFHHEHNATDVMNAQGAKRWMLHMGHTLLATDFRGVDPRIKPCIVDFLRHKLQKYAAAQHVTHYAQWRFDESDFAFVTRDPEMLAIWRAGPGSPGFSSLSEEDQLALKLALATPATLEGFSAKELKAYLAARNVDATKVAACVEKADMLALAQASARQ